MAIISVFSAAFSKAEEVMDRLAARTGWERIDDRLFREVSERFQVAPEHQMRAMEGPPFLFNKYTHRREKHLAQIRLTLAEMLTDNQILHGFASHLIPQRVGHVLQVCLLSDPEVRAADLAKESGGSLDEARRRIREEDKKRAQWTQRLFGTQPWDQTLYDLKIPVNEVGIEEAVEMILENAERDVMACTEDSRRALLDFLAAARSEMALVESGHYHDVSCEEGTVTVTIDSYVIRLEKLEAELKKILSGVEGVTDVCFKTGPNYRPTSMFANVDFELPEKVLLVDDEKDFVLTLSERLEMRDLEPAIAHSGEEALNLLKEEEPEVMVLDLKMPGIDGIEVLRRVKVEHADVKVIVLTGHGSDKDRELCMDLGAFAYLEKPVDIEVLSDTMRRAKEAAGETGDSDT